ncbi:hypothetical protein JCM5353_003685 [Sporobolomyces roseus]
MPFLTKSSILFVLLNFLRLLSFVAICVAFSGEVVTMVSDLRTVQSSSHHSSSPSTVPSATATSNIFRRSSPDPVYSTVPTITSLPVYLDKREPASLRELDTSSPTSTSTRRSTRTTSSPAITATNSPSSSSSPAATQACSYLSSTSIPTQPGGSLFSTLSRIFCCVILAFSLLSELPPPITTRAGRAVERWWNYVFPPFGREFGVGVLGGTQVFVGCTVLSHAVGKFTQVSGWLLFVVGILNFLCGLAFGSRLKVIRSPFADSTSPSALRKLRLGNGNSSSAHINAHDDDEGLEAMTERARDGQEKERRKWYRFENASAEESSIGLHHPSASTSTLNNTSEGRRVHFGGSTGGERAPKRSASRNGPNGIVISAPMQLRGGAGGVPEEENAYGEMEEIRQNGASSRASSRGGGGGISIPPPVYSGSH